jgi:hypothetical protein
LKEDYRAPSGGNDPSTGFPRHNPTKQNKPGVITKQLRGGDRYIKCVTIC